MCLKKTSSKATYIKMNKIVNKFLLAEDTFMPEMHLKQPEFTYSAFRPFTKKKERIQKFIEQDTEAIFPKMNLIRLAFSMIWLMVILNI